ncbi:unnamed protein product [Cylindrotheca closterium]|uniref:Uncharacterized protein n=1 Tax=Cylindrotheca closterium TaxID=2856 RepID=A0AAD2GDD7_9STRA|nr:unnamed protein product [Cylindrotheca closterium]
MTSIDIQNLQDFRTSWNNPSANDGSKSPRSVDDSVFHVWQKPDTGFHDLKIRFEDQMFGGHSSLDSDIHVDADIDNVDNVDINTAINTAISIDIGETIVFDNHSDDDDDVIMQIDENEGLLNLNEYYDSISNDVGRPQELLADAVLTNVSTAADDDTNSFFSCESSDTHDRRTASIYPFQHHHHQQQEQQQFQESLHKLNQSMKKSQATRKSLYAKTPKLKDYQRSSTVRNVLHRIEYSSRQIDSFYHHSTSPASSSSSSAKTRMMTTSIS